VRCDGPGGAGRHRLAGHDVRARHPDVAARRPHDERLGVRRDQVTERVREATLGEAVADDDPPADPRVPAAVHVPDALLVPV
jgi:hypothetical protein